jgi:hypothetical protein
MTTPAGCWAVASDVMLVGTDEPAVELRDAEKTTQVIGEGKFNRLTVLQFSNHLSWEKN